MLFETVKDYTQIEPVRLLITLVENSNGGEENIITISYRPAKMQLQHEYEFKYGQDLKIRVSLRGDFTLNVNVSNIYD